jgi:hypothetical protein
MEWWEFFIVMAIVLPIMVLWLGCILDAITRPDVSGWGKAGWVVFILVLPIIGSIVYIVTRPAVVSAQPGLGDRTLPTSPTDMPTTAPNVDPRYLP